MNKACWTTLALTCLAVFAAPAWPASPEPDAADPAAQWEHFLATADLPVIESAFDAIDAVAYDGATVDAESCRQQAGTLEKAVEKVPVSMALRRAAYLCAQATGDAQAADRAMAELLALAKQAYRDAGDDGTGPIRVLAPSDAVALVLTSGMDMAYGYYPQPLPQRHFPFVIAARDRETGVERHLTFDYVDALFRIDHEAPFVGFPLKRNTLANTFIDALAKNGVLDAVDRQATTNALQGAAAQRIATLRSAAERGGVEASATWLMLCEQAHDAGCASGLVDALLPQAEKQNAYPMVLLAMAYLDGVGIPRDPKAAWTLLDGANHRWYMDGAYVEFTKLWLQAHGATAVLPPELQVRLAQATQHGNRFPQRLRIAVKVRNKEVLTAADVAFLTDAAENLNGSGYEMLSEAAQAAGRSAEMVQWMLKAADAGDADAQARYGIALDKGDYGLAADRAKARQVLENGAHGGSTDAATYRAYLAELEGRWKDAEGWLLPAVIAGRHDAALELANMYEQEFPGLSGKVDRAVMFYRALDQDGSAPARRHLANLAIQGRGLPKDPEQARKWLLQDAEKDDPESMVQLAGLYASGYLGKADMAEANRWMERALATGNANARNESASLLYHLVGTSEARARALALWQQGANQDDNESRNNLAWALCTSAYPAELDANRGLALAKAMGSLDSLHVAFLDTLASCHAAAGEYERGAELQQRVIDQVQQLYSADTPAERERRLQDYRERLDLYRARKPYRVPVPAPAAQSDASKPNSSVSVTSSPTK